MFPEWATGRGQGHVSNLCIVENFATASRRYTGDNHNLSVVGLFMTPIGQWKRLGRVMVEWTCSLHIVTLQRLNFMTSNCSGLVIQIVSALLHGNWQDFNWHDASRGPSAIAELLVLLSWLTIGDVLVEGVGDFHNSILPAECLSWSLIKSVRMLKIFNLNKEWKCVDTIDTLSVLWADHFQC